MDRKFFKILEEWKSRPDVALILDGPRQVGKTYAMKKLAKSYPSHVYINLEEDQNARKIFESTNVANEIYEEFSLRNVEFNFNKGKPLFILDEIQACPKAYSALKPLVIDGRCDIISSGSLLGVELMKGDYLSPMGYARFVNVDSMDFEEFLWAIGIDQESISKIRSKILEEKELSPNTITILTEQFKRYLIIGGMPKVVKAYADSRDYMQSWTVLEEVYHILESDATRYSGKEDKLKILACLKSLPSQLAKENKTFVYHDVEKMDGVGRKTYGSALNWLEKAGIINICYNLEEPSEPLAQMERRDSFKVYVKDPGILAYMYGTETTKSVANGDYFVNKGALMENYVAQALISNGYSLHFFSKRNSTLEIDFIINYNGKLTAIEVKSGKNKRAKSLLTITSGTYKVKQGIKVSDGKLERDENSTLHIPLFGPSFFEHPSLPILPTIDTEQINSILKDDNY